MSLRARLYLACGAIILLLLIPALYGLGRLAELRDIAFDLQSRHAAASLAMGRLQTSIAELNRLQRSYVAAPGEEARTALYEVLGRTDGYLSRLEEAGYGEPARRQAADLARLREATFRLDSLLRAGQEGAATVYFEEIKPVYDEAQAGLTRLAELIDRRSRAEAARAQEISSTAARTTAFALTAALVLALAVGLFAVGALTSPLRRLRSAVAAVAGGRFVSPPDLPYGRSDEIGDLCVSFRAMTRRLAELDRVKAEFVSIASHELKTPVSVIEGYAEMLEDGVYGEVSGEQAEILEYMREQTRVLTERVNQLLSLSRFEAGGLEVAVSDIRLEDLLDDLRHAFTAVASQKGVEFRVERDADAPETLQVDPDRVRHELLGNVISNAFKFTPAGGRVELRAWSAEGGDRVVFEVQDTGEGIPPAQLPYIFEKYYQAGHQAGKVGTGLGLAIAREIAEAHGGAISAESEPGKGTTFRVELPTHGNGGGPRGARRR